MKKIHIFLFLSFGTIVLNAQGIYSEFVTNLNEQSIRIETNSISSKVKITMKGPSDGYFAFGFGTDNMSNAYTIVCNSENGVAHEQVLAQHNEGTALANSLTILKDTTIKNIKTIIIERDLKVLANGYYDFSSLVAGSNLSIIFSQSDSKSLDTYHTGGRGSAEITFETLVTNVSNKKSGINFSIFPNPTENKFTVTFDKKISNTKITIFNDKYTPIKSEMFENVLSITYSLEDLKAGIYFISIKNDTYTYFDKIVKQ